MMTCPDCNGPVDVLCFNGARARCGCGKTMADAPQPPPAPPHAGLRELIAVLRDGRVSSYSAAGMTLVMHPDAWATSASALGDTPAAHEPMPLCKCGHAVAAEHTEAGCVHGCSIKLCEESLAQEAA